MNANDVAPGRCGRCRALVDLEDLFCPNCGTEIPGHEADLGTRLETGAKNFGCVNCGASMNYDASARSLKCPFCGSVDLLEEPARGILRPDVVLPFRLDLAGAERALREWLGTGIWRPDDLRHAAKLTELTAVYVPFWIFRTRVQTCWTADSSRTPAGARGDWFPLAGERSAEYDGLWVPASEGVSTRELDLVAPFDPSQGVPPDRVDLEDVTVEQFAVSRRYARPHAQGLVEQREAEAVAAAVPGRARNVHVNVLLEGATSTAAIAPIYVMAYRYREKLYRFVLNGQTGKATGSAPVSAGKVGLLVAFVVVVLLIILLAVAQQS